MKLPPGVDILDPTIAELDRRRREMDARDPATELVRHPNDGLVMAEPWPMWGTTREALRAVIRALIPPPPAPQATDMVDRIEDTARRTYRSLHPMTARVMVLAMWLLDLAPIWRFKHLRRMRSLSQAEASAVLDGLSNSRLTILRYMVLAARALLLAFYYDQDEVQEAMGYRPVEWQHSRVAFRRRLLEGRLPTPEDRIGPFSEAATERADTPREAP